MKKIINILSTLLIIFGWYFLISESNNKNKISEKYFETGLLFFNQEVYSEAINNFQKSNSIKENIKSKKKIVESLINLNKYDEAIKLLNNKDFSSEFRINTQEDIMESLIKIKEYKKFNQFIKIIDKNLGKKLNQKYISKFELLQDGFRDINYNPNDKKIYAINNLENQWKLINTNGKFISPEYYEKIININYPNILLFESNFTKIKDINNKIFSKLPTSHIVGYGNNILVKKIDNKFEYINRAGESLSIKYDKASNFNNDKALVLINNEVYLIDKYFNKLKKLNADNFKSDFRNNAIFNNKIVLIKDKKCFIHDIKTKKNSNYYDDIDFYYNNLIAVKNNNKWGYINENYTKVIDYIYDFANSFTLDLGIVIQKGEYLIISKNNNIEFKSKKELKPFSEEGISFIKNENGWDMIRLVRYIND